jgi:hypothetical protein
LHFVGYTKRNKLTMHSTMNVKNIGSIFKGPVYDFDVELHLRPRFRGTGQRVVRKVTKSVTTCAHVVRA